MKPFFTVLLALLLFACQSNDSQARKPKVVATAAALQPINQNIIAQSVLYEANIRQYSPEGTFNAFAKDLCGNAKGHRKEMVRCRCG